MAYALNLYVLVATFATLAMALSFFSGRTGYISLLHAGFFGLGAYANAILLIRFGVPPPLGWLVAALAGGAIAFGISRPLFRTRGDYFAILTIVAQVAFGLLLVNADRITNGPLGLAAIPQWPFSYGPLVAPILFSTLAIAVLILLRRFEKSAWADFLTAIRDDETLMLSLGNDVSTIKAMAFAVSAAICAIVGALYAQHLSFIDPTTFQLSDSILILAIVIVGGMRHAAAVVAASAFMVLLPEAMRFMPISSSHEANLREIVYAAILVIVIVSRRRLS